VRALVASLVIASALPLVGDAQSPSPQPTFRTGTTLVEVSAIVTAGGRPVTDLRADEVTVLDNGEPQAVAIFERVDLGGGELTSQRRDFVLVLDDLHIAPANTSLAIGAALAFVDALGPHDRLGLMNTGLGDLRLDPTTEREPARALVRKLRGQRRDVVSLEAEMRARTALGVLQDIAAALRSDAAERRAVLLISEGHPGFIQDSSSMLSPGAQAAFDAYRGVLREAALSNVAIYTVDPRGLTAPGGAQLSSRETALAVGQQPQQIRDSDVFGSLAILARNTGGLQTLWTNDLTSVFPRILEDSRQYYRIAYAQPEPAKGRKQPAQRSIKVKVSRPGVEVRARERYAPASVS
jgi:VWFA-related protein